MNGRQVQGIKLQPDWQQCGLADLVRRVAISAADVGLLLSFGESKVEVKRKLSRLDLIV